MLAKLTLDTFAFKSDHSMSHTKIGLCYDDDMNGEKIKTKREMNQRREFLCKSRRSTLTDLLYLQLLALNYYPTILRHYLV